MSLIPSAPALNLRENWNLCPTQDIIAVTTTPAGRVGSLMHWGMIPGWAKEGKMTYPTFNARIEPEEEGARPGYQTKATFRNAWARKHRCLVVIDGYYEWRPSDKQPFALAYVDRRPMALAGLWETWRAKDGSETITSCTMLTGPSPVPMKDLHDRAPIFLQQDQWPVWLGESDGDAEALVHPYHARDIEWWPVGKEVGKRQSSGPQLADPIA